jgi:hypothetical protein
MVTHRFGLSEAVEAFRLFDGGHSGKVMLVSEEVDAAASRQRLGASC